MHVFKFMAKNEILNEETYNSKLLILKDPVIFFILKCCILYVILIEYCVCIHYVLIRLYTCYTYT